MIRSIFKHACLAFCAVFIYTNANADTGLKKESFTEVIEKSFNIEKDGDVLLLNKYGKMNIKTWINLKWM